MAMETFATWMRLFELLKYYSWIVDRFHLSTRMFQKMARGKEYDFRWLEERLAVIGFRLVLCTRTAESFAVARAQRLQVSGKPDQYNDLSIFVREQEMLQQMANDSILPKMELDVSDNNVARACDRIADWLRETGGLYANY